MRPGRLILPPLAVLALLFGGPSPAAAGEGEGFRFGSYGRVSVGSDLRGGPGRHVQLVAHAPRLLQGSYAELDFSYAHLAGDGRFHTQLTLGLDDKLFHFDGDFASQIAIRNLYVEARDVLAPGLSLWIGSRMYRGADNYLLDFWPLDFQNTVGGGAAYRTGELEVRLHVGMNRLDDRYQLQTILEPADDFGAREVIFMERQRVVATLRVEHGFDLCHGLRLGAVLYGEVHALPSGIRRLEQGQEETLPDDRGWLVGTQVALSGFGDPGYAHLTLRYARGLAAYGELAVPFGLGTDKRAARAEELLAALSGGWDGDDFGVLLGAFLRRFRDADPNVFDRDDVWELAAAVRPSWFVTDHFRLAGEASVQLQRPDGLSLETGRHEVPVAVQLALMPSIALDRKSLARPELRLIYAATWLDDAALRTYPRESPLRAHRVQHYLGLSVEWWFNSSRYP